MKQFVLFITFYVILSCTNRNSASDEITLENTIVTDTLKPIALEPIKKTRFYFMVFTTEQPAGMYTTNFNNQKNIRREKVRHTTEIVELSEDISEDLKFKILDNAELNLRETKLKAATSQYSNYARAYNIEDANTESIILSRNIYLFDSYAEASKARQENMNNLYE